MSIYYNLQGFKSCPSCGSTGGGYVYKRHCCGKVTCSNCDRNNSHENVRKHNSVALHKVFTCAYCSTNFTTQDFYEAIPESKSSNVAGQGGNHKMVIGEIYKSVSKPSTPPQQQAQSSSSGGCYIATACYGSYDAPEVKIFREFRDKTLSNLRLGRLFIRCYYKISPNLAEVLKTQPKINTFIRSRILDRIYQYLIK